MVNDKQIKRLLGKNVRCHIGGTDYVESGDKISVELEVVRVRRDGDQKGWIIAVPQGGQPQPAVLIHSDNVAGKIVEDSEEN